MFTRTSALASFLGFTRTTDGAVRIDRARRVVGQIGTHFLSRREQRARVMRIDLAVVVERRGDDFLVADQSLHLGDRLHAMADAVIAVRRSRLLCERGAASAVRPTLPTMRAVQRYEVVRRAACIIQCPPQLTNGTHQLPDSELKYGNSETRQKLHRRRHWTLPFLPPTPAASHVRFRRECARLVRSLRRKML